MKPKTCKEVAAKWLDSQEFYELMQGYRHAPIHKQQQTIEAFEALNDFIRVKLLCDLDAAQPGRTGKRRKHLKKLLTNGAGIIQRYGSIPTLFASPCRRR